MAGAPFQLAVPADLMVLSIGVELAAVIFPAALPLAVGSAANKLVGMITGKLEQSLAAAAVAITHQAAPNRDASHPLRTHHFERFGTRRRKRRLEIKSGVS
jgi:hypothetical protein